jgi:hypothetical protein
MKYDAMLETIETVAIIIAVEFPDEASSPY